MQIRITRIVSKVGLFTKRIELEETLFLHTDIREDELFSLIKAIGETIIKDPQCSPMIPLTKKEADNWLPPKD